MTIWYRTGTVTVTNGSKNVVGVDTTFNTSIYPGDLFTVDENVFYEVADVTSNLNFTLQRNYAGTTGSGKSYVVVPLSPKRQLTAELAARVNVLIERYRGAIEAWTAGGWAVDTNGDYKVSGDTDRKLVPIENGGGGLGTATKRWGQVHANSVTIAGQAVVPKTAPTALGIPVADENGNIADGWISTALLGSNDAMVFKGTLGTGGTVTALPTADYVRGWTYKIITAGTYAGVDYALGDLIIALSSFNTEFKNSDWIPAHIADEMNLKADVTYVDAGLGLKADVDDVADALALKADMAYVEYLMMEGDPA